jgi:hypothetical protein
MYTSMEEGVLICLGFHSTHVFTTHDDASSYDVKVCSTRSHDVPRTPFIVPIYDLQELNRFAIEIK